MRQLFPIILCTLIGGICYRYAKQRGRNPYTWFAIGLLFGIFGLIALFILPPLSSSPTTKKRKSSPAELLPPAISLKLEALDPSHSSKMWYYLDQENKQFGPMSLDALTSAWCDGKVSATTYVWNELMENWRRFEEVVRTPLHST